MVKKNYSLGDKLLIGIIATLIIGGLIWIFYYLTDESIWSTEVLSNEEMFKRQEIRNMITSLFMSLTGVITSILLIAGINFNVASYQAFISLLSLGLLSFILANTIVTENGINILLHGLNGDNEGVSSQNISDAFKYSFGNIVDSKLIRYIITTFMDIFISIMLTDSFTWVFVKKFCLDTKLSEIFVILFTGVITFIIFTNPFKLKWAFPSVDTLHEQSELLPTSFVLISVMFSGFLFLIWNPLILKKVGIVSVQGKIVMLLILFGLIFYGYLASSLDPVLEYEITNKVVDCNHSDPSSSKCTDTKITYNKIPSVSELHDNGNYGVLIYFLITVLCMAITVYTSEKTKINSKSIAIIVGVIIFVNIPSIISFF
jgi:hypothetical protein